MEKGSEEQAPEMRCDYFSDVKTAESPASINSVHSYSQVTSHDGICSTPHSPALVDPMRFFYILFPFSLDYTLRTFTETPHAKGEATKDFTRG